MSIETKHHPGDSTACCPTCDITAFARNNFFHGKLMLERDFTDEQRYHIDKMRLHNQRLHGWGVVCGLQVLADTNPACRDRFVTVQPGMAIDCCGHEIVVTDPVRIDITRLPSYPALTGDGAPARRPLQLCIRYRECGTDVIPVLYDECAWDNDRCAPNRISESFDFDLLGPDEDPVGGGHTHVVTLGLVRTIGINRATRMAAHADSDRLYVATAPINGNNSGDLFQLTLSTEAVRSAADLEGRVAALGVSPDGDWVYVLRGNDDNPPNAYVDKYAATAINEAAVATVPLGIPLGDHTGLAVTISGDIVVLAGDYLIALDSALVEQARVPNADARCIAAGLSDERVYVGADAGVVASVEYAAPALTLAPVHTLAVPAGILDLAVIPGAPSDDLVVLTDAHHVVLVSAGAEFGPATVDTGASQLGAAADGRRAVVAGTAGAQVVNLVSLRSGNSGVRAPFAIGAGITGGQGDVLVGADNTYVAYPGDAAVDPGGVAVLGTIGLIDCEDLLWKSSQMCPNCDDPGCIVLATMLDYDPGDRLVDKGTAAVGSTEVEIDNRLGRRLLPSTSTLTELVECLLNRPGGTGDAIDGNNGADGDPGAPGLDGEGLEAGLVRISAISWIHRGVAPPIGIEDSQYRGFAIEFTGEVQTMALDDNIFRVKIDTRREGAEHLRCRCELRGTVVPITVEEYDDDRISRGKLLPDGVPAKAVAFLLDQVDDGALVGDQIETLIELHGDFVLDTGNPARAIDAEFVRGALPTGDRPIDSELGIQGGLFESWFTIGRRFVPFQVRVNTADRGKLRSIPGVGDAVADRILEERADTPFTGAEDFFARVNPQNHLWLQMRGHLDFTPPEG